MSARHFDDLLVQERRMGEELHTARRDASRALDGER